jgi:hypothetical protein
MSRHSIRRFVLSGLLALAAAGAGIAYANAPSLDVRSAGALMPSDPPALLAPITQAGRKGWACKPEQAAASAQTREAMLPGHSDR